jgi:hypothetical protein
MPVPAPPPPRRSWQWCCWAPYANHLAASPSSMFIDSGMCGQRWHGRQPHGNTRTVRHEMSREASGFSHIVNPPPRASSYARAFFPAPRCVFFMAMAVPKSCTSTNESGYRLPLTSSSSFKYCTYSELTSPLVHRQPLTYYIPQQSVQKNLEVANAPAASASFPTGVIQPLSRGGGKQINYKYGLYEYLVVGLSSKLRWQDLHGACMVFIQSQVS